jgi:hypothetical protein
MNKFREMAAKAKEEYHEATAAAEAKLEAENTARSQLVDAAVSVLETHVLSVIEQAQREFRAEGIEMRVEKAYDVKSYTIKNPSITIKCAGPIRPSDNYQEFSRACVFSSDGQRVFAELAEDFRRHSKAKTSKNALVESAGALVEEGVASVLEAYFEALPDMTSAANLRH